MKRALTFEPFSPQMAKMVEEGSMMKQIRKKDILLSYPYESMEPFLRLIKEASADPNVMTIKITIYRLARKTRLVEYLCAAAENGKEVTVLIELRARFDEQNNIDWSERLEEAGCRVIYGFEGYKVHSKICLITYRHLNEIQYITQIGTGNYNEKTAEMYTDVSLMTSSRSIGEDAAEFFNNMSISNLDGRYEELIRSLGGVDLQLLGLGHNGHIGFNEPGEAFEKETHCVDLTESTIEANKRFFASADDVPKQAYTMGIKTIMQAKKILIVVNGENKADIVERAFFGPVTPEVPASILQLHNDVTLVGDEAALAKIGI